MRSTSVESGPQIVVNEDDSRPSGRPESGLCVRILGCSGGIGRNLRTTSVLLNDNVLIDMGTGVGELSLSELQQVNTLFLTHSHLDHTAMLPMFREHNPLTVYALPETIEALRTHIFNDVIWPDFELLPNVANAVVRFEAIDSGESIQMDGFRVHAVDAVHAVPSLGYCVESDRGVFAFSGDTMTNKTLWPRLNKFRSVDTLIVEVSFPNAQESLARLAGHYTPQMLAEDLKELKHTPRIWVTAMKPGFQEQIFDEVLQAIPGRDVRRLKREDEFAL